MKNRYALISQASGAEDVARVVRDQLTGFWRFVSALPRALRERRRIARRSTVSRTEIAAWTVHK